MNSRSAPATRGSAPAILAGAALGGAAAAWLDSNSFAGYVAAALAASVFIGLERSAVAIRIAAAACTMSFPLLVVRSGESGLLWGPAITLVVLAGATVFRGLRRGLVAAMALALILVLYIASLGSHLVLIRGFQQGSQMVSAFFLMAGSYAAVSTLAAGRLGTGRSWFDWRAGLAGMVTCAGVAFATRALLDLRISWTAELILAVVVSGSAAVGSAVGALVADDRAGSGIDPRVLRHINAMLVAAPAFYYGFRLYLT